MIRRNRFSRPSVAETRAPLRDLYGTRSSLASPSARAVLLSEFLYAWQTCLRDEGLYTLFVPETLPELAITVDERELAYLLTQYGAILTRMHQTRDLRSSAEGSRETLAMLRLAVIRAQKALQSATLLERRHFLEASLSTLGVRTAHDETKLELGSIFMIPAVSAVAIGIREVSRVDLAAIARAVTDALREIRPYLEEL